MQRGRGARRIFERIEETVREIAALFIALAPLDVVLGTERPNAFRNGLIFVVFGVILLAMALYLERRHLDG